MPWERNADGHRTLKYDWYRGELPEGVSEKQVIAVESAMDEFFAKHPQESKEIPLGISQTTHHRSTLKDLRVMGFNEYLEFDISVDIYGNVGHEWWGRGGGYEFMHGNVEDEHDEVCDVEEEDV